MAATGHAHGVGSGENAHEWAEGLRQQVVAFEDDNGEPLVLHVERPLKPHGQRLMDSLGVEVQLVTPMIDVQAATSSQDCLQPGCPQEAEAGRTHCRHHRELGEPVVLAGRRVEDRPAVVALPPVARPAKTPRRRATSSWTREQIIEAIQAHAREHGYPPVASEWALHDERRPSREDAKRAFGSWADAVEAAGFPRPRRGVSARFLKDSSSERAADPGPEEDHDTTPPEREDQRLGPDPSRSEGADLTAVRAAALQAVNAIFDLLEQVEQACANREGER